MAARALTPVATQELENAEHDFLLLQQEFTKDLPDYPRVAELMMSTFSAQRTLIDMGMKTEVIAQKWPFFLLHELFFKTF